MMAGKLAGARQRACRPWDQLRVEHTENRDDFESQRHSWTPLITARGHDVFRDATNNSQAEYGVLHFRGFEAVFVTILKRCI